MPRGTVFVPVKHVVASAVVWALAFVPAATAQVNVTFQKVVDSQTPIPGGLGPFGGFTLPGLRGSSVVFYAWGNLGERGIYLKTPAQLSVIADVSTPVPGGPGPFAGFYDPPLISDTEVTFVGWGLPGGSTAFGVYLHSGGTLSRVADSTTPIPGTTDTFNYFRTASVDQGQVAFAASGPATGEGVYTAIGGQIQLVAGPSTPMPEDGRPFATASWPVVQNGAVVFTGYNPSFPFRQGIYSRSGGGPVMVLANTDTPVPGGTGVFSALAGGFSVDGGDVGFGAFGSGGGGVYLYKSGSVSQVGDQATPVPGGTGTFTSLRAIAVDNGQVAFAGVGTDREGIYANLDGSLAKVIDSRDRLDGKEITQLNLGAQALSNGVIAFSVVFADGSSGIYLASLSLARVCSTTLTATPIGLDLRFDLRTADPVVWNLWLSYGSTTTRFWSLPVPVIGTTISIPWSIPGLINRGSLGFLSTFVTAQQGIVCSDWDVVDTGQP